MYQTASACHIKDTVLSNEDAKFNKSWVFLFKKFKIQLREFLSTLEGQKYPRSEASMLKNRMKIWETSHKGQKTHMRSNPKKCLAFQKYSKQVIEIQQIPIPSENVKHPLKPLLMPFSKSTLPHKRGGWWAQKKCHPCKSQV